MEVLENTENDLQIDHRIIDCCVIALTHKVQNLRTCYTTKPVNTGMFMNFPCQLTQLMIQLQKMPELHRTEMLTAYNSGHMNVINTIFNALPTLFNTFKFDKKNMKPLLLANNSNEYPGLFSAIQHKQQNVVETVYLALSNHARLFGFTAEDIMDFWQHKAPQKYSAFELAFELGHRVIAELILNTLNKMAESFGFTDNPRYIAEKNYMEALLKKASPHTVR